MNLDLGVRQNKKKAESNTPRVQNEVKRIISIKRNSRVKKVKKITAYGKCFGKLKRILEDAVFHSMYAEQLEDLERHMDKFVNMVQVKCQTAQGELR